MVVEPTTNFFDLRRLIGILLTFYGLVLIIYGAVAAPTTSSVSMNLDLWWGVLTLVVGVLFLLLSLRKPRPPEKEED